MTNIIISKRFTFCTYGSTFRVLQFNGTWTASCEVGGRLKFILRLYIRKPLIRKYSKKVLSVSNRLSTKYCDKWPLLPNFKCYLKSGTLFATSQKLPCMRKN